MSREAAFADCRGRPQDGRSGPAAWSGRANWQPAAIRAAPCRSGAADSLRGIGAVHHVEAGLERNSIPGLGIPEDTEPPADFNYEMWPGLAP